MKKNAVTKVLCGSCADGGLRRKLLPLLIAGCFSAGHALANPYGGQVVNGQASIVSQGNVLTVTNSPGAIINWQGFSIGAGELTRFVQQGASSAVLNRIVGQDPSQILGALQSNGRVFLINPNGILFGQGAQVNVAGLVASTLNISNEDFLAGRMKFQAGDKAANLQNQGSIATPAGGQIYLIAPNVENSGILTSPKGEVVLAAGHSVHLVEGANPDLHVVVSAPDNQALNLGQVVAEGGNIGIYGALVSQRGLVSANSAVVGENGKIVFKASKDALLEAGSVTTATGAGSGGTVHVLGERVALTGDAKIDVSGQLGGGTVLVGGDYQGKNAAVTNAKQNFFGSSAEIRADAVQQGDGGKVILWADDSTRAYGSISARGGQEGGNGGFVEVSGKQNLAFDARVDVGAPNGRRGQVLLDPRDIIINAAGSGPGNAAASDGQVDIFDADALTDLTISESALEALIGDVTLQATRDINIVSLSDAKLAMSGITSGTFTMLAGGSIDAAGQSIDTGGGAVTMNAGGNINFQNMVTNGGNVTLTAGGTIHAQYINANDLKMTAVGGINNGAGGSMSVWVNQINAANFGSGDIQLFQGNGFLSIVDIGSVGYGIRQTGGGRIVVETGEGGLSIDAAVAADGGAINIVGGMGSLQNNSSVSTSGNVINMTVQSGDLYNAGNVTATNGSISLAANNGEGGRIINGGSLSASGGGISLSADREIQNNGVISTNGSAIILSASMSDSIIQTGFNSQISSAGGTIGITADKMDIGGAVDAGNGTVRLATSSPSAIHLGADSENAAQATLELAASELGLIKANTLAIGDGFNGAATSINILSSLLRGNGGALDNISTLSLTSSGTVTQQSGAVIGAAAVSVIGADVNLMEANATGVVSGRATAGDFQYRTVNHLAVSNINGVAGISASNTIRLVSDSNASISQALDSPLSAPQLVVQTPGAVSLGNSANTVGYVAADISLGGTGVGSFSMINNGNLVIDGPYFGIGGITTNNQNVEISVMPGYSITQNQPINAGTGTVNLNSTGMLSGFSPISPTAPTSPTTIPNLALNQAVITNATNVIVNSGSGLTPSANDGMPGDSPDQDPDNTGNSAEQNADQTQSGASNNEASQKLYCN